ncbi:MAG: cyclophilin [Rhodospirillaceae bacterium]|nr:cyclophilin [Rhodospirillaceae bacterium]|tara:strand:- start:16603 stop:17178 length:576 start_codon:yes stop_codon:yes gene_type:complete
MLKRYVTAMVAFAAVFYTIGAFAADGSKRVKITTNLGVIEVELAPNEAPASVENFLNYAKAGFYDGTVFHRVIEGFMIQGGGFEKGLKKKDTKDPIQNEADNGLQNLVGTLAMARTNDPHSATAQFFINTADNHFLNHTDKSPRGWGYAVFGKVTSGMEVVRQIEGVQTGQLSGMGDVPLEEVVIEKVEVE